MQRRRLCCYADAVFVLEDRPTTGVATSIFVGRVKWVKETDMIYKLIRRNTEPSRWSRGVKYILIN
ncbi:hypothetical protein BGU94_18755 [Clostridioides difficile]|uniref:hypothetical protein n=1 Tax=Clostridioides difficile TaxID=1496 RepID=UPI000BB3700E|nr:hypothetical protein [Clostridioides difficile]PBH62290.1 hypothetical protein BGU94_18755 [Clostridioides difficile]